jgi:hypothetical protein
MPRDTDSSLRWRLLTGDETMMRSVTNEVLLGIGAGYLASKLMDMVTTAYQERQSESSKQREEQLQEVPAYVKAAEKLAAVKGVDLDPERAEQLGLRLHRGLGLSGGVTAGLLVSRGMNPLEAGILTGLGLWLLVDEGASALFGLTPPPNAYPRETHVRGLVGHVAYGGTLGILLGVGNTLFLKSRRSEG